MTAYDVFLVTSQRKRERAGLQVHGRTYDDAASMAALIFDVPVDVVKLEVVR